MTAPINLEYPFTGQWLVQNSPANNVPSHGTTLFGTSYAIDFVPVTPRGKTAPVTIQSFFRPERPESFPGFGRQIFAPVTGKITAVHNASPDHEAYRGLASLGYALTQQNRLRSGWVSLAGNHVFIQTPDAFIALCHLQLGSITVQPGQTVRVGDPLGRCGNSGNSTEPHLHLQAFQNFGLAPAASIPLSFRGSLPRNGEVLNIS